FRRQWFEEITLDDNGVDGRQVALGTRDGDRVDVGRVEARTGDRCGDGEADRAGAATQVGDHTPHRKAGRGLTGEQERAETRDEDTRRHRHPQATEVSPAEQLLQWSP